MTELKDYRKTETIELPQSGGEVDVYDGLLNHQIEEVSNNQDQSISEMLTYYIADWDFEIDGEKAEITEDNIRMLHMNDTNAIQEAAGIQDFIDKADVKK